MKQIIITISESKRENWPADVPLPSGANAGIRLNLTTAGEYESRAELAATKMVMQRVMRALSMTDGDARCAAVDVDGERIDPGDIWGQGVGKN